MRLWGFRQFEEGPRPRRLLFLLSIGPGEGPTSNEAPESQEGAPYANEKEALQASFEACKGLRRTIETHAEDLAPNVTKELLDRVHSVIEGTREALDNKLKQRSVALHAELQAIETELSAAIEAVIEEESEEDEGVANTPVPSERAREGVGGGAGTRAAVDSAPVVPDTPDRVVVDAAPNSTPETVDTPDAAPEADQISLDQWFLKEYPTFHEGLRAVQVNAHELKEKARHPDLGRRLPEEVWQGFIDRLTAIQIEAAGIDLNSEGRPDLPFLTQVADEENRFSEAINALPMDGADFDGIDEQAALDGVDRDTLDGTDGVAALEGTPPDDELAAETSQNTETTQETADAPESRTFSEFEPTLEGFLEEIAYYQELIDDMNAQGAEMPAFLQARFNVPRLLRRADPPSVDRVPTAEWLREKFAQENPDMEKLAGRMGRFRDYSQMILNEFDVAQVEFSKLQNPDQGLRYGNESEDGGTYEANLFDDHFRAAGRVLENTFNSRKLNVGGNGAYARVAGAELTLSGEGAAKEISGNIRVKLKWLPDSQAIDVPVKSGAFGTWEEAMTAAMVQVVENEAVASTLPKQLREYRRETDRRAVKRGDVRRSGPDVPLRDAPETKEQYATPPALEDRAPDERSRSKQGVESDGDNVPNNTVIADDLPAAEPFPDSSPEVDSSAEAPPAPEGYTLSTTLDVRGTPEGGQPYETGVAENTLYVYKNPDSVEQYKFILGSPPNHREIPVTQVSFINTEGYQPSVSMWLDFGDGKSKKINLENLRPETDGVVAPDPLPRSEDGVA